MGKYIINLYSSGISRLVKIRDVEKLQQDIENDLVIKDQMPPPPPPRLSFSVYLWRLSCGILVAVHTRNHLDRGDEPENEGYESERP